MESVICFVAVIILSFLTANAVELTVSPVSPVLRRRGDNIVFTCSFAVKSQNLILSWTDKDGSTLITETKLSSRVYIEHVSKSQLKLFINKIEKSDEGTYTCKGKKSDGESVEVTAKLTTYQGMEFDLTTPQHPVLHTSAVIKCSVTGSPTPEVSWKYNGISISTGGRYKVVAEGLRIEDISESDNGDYICHGEILETGDTEDHNIYVEVYVPPSIISSTGKIEKVEKDEAEFKCQATGKPAPSYRFYKDNADVPLSESDNIEIDANAGILYIPTVTKDDEGKYKCEAINAAGSAYGDGELFVIVPPRLNVLANKTVEERQTVSLVCDVIADPPADMAFRKVGSNADYVEGENDDGHITVIKADNILELKIKDVTPQDTGSYTCFANNIGGDLVASGSIIVQYAPQFKADSVAKFYAWTDSQRNITCTALGEPQPEIEWYHSGSKLEHSETYKVFNLGGHGVLQVSVKAGDQEWIYGEYKCRATNELGSQEQVLTLSEATVPGKPEWGNYTDRTPTTIDLVIKPPLNDGGMLVFGYRIEYESSVMEVHTDDYPVTIKNLKPATSYAFRIQALNDVGPGEAIDVIAETTQQSRPYPIEIKSSFESIYSNKFEVIWDDPNTGGLPIEKYRINYRMVRAKQEDDGSLKIVEPLESWKEQIVDETSSNPVLAYTIEGLTGKAYYQIAVQACNALGCSDNHATTFVGQTGIEDAQVDGSSVVQATAGSTTIIVVVVVVFFIFLITIDVSCHFLNNCGVVSSICEHVCGQRPISHEKQMEAGESQPLAAHVDDPGNDGDQSIANNKAENYEKERLISEPALLVEEECVKPVSDYKTESVGNHIESPPPYSDHIAEEDSKKDESIADDKVDELEHLAKEPIKEEEEPAKEQEQQEENNQSLDENPVPQEESKEGENLQQQPEQLEQQLQPQVITNDQDGPLEGVEFSGSTPAENGSINESQQQQQQPVVT